jgi:hypothetical protein
MCLSISRDLGAAVESGGREAGECCPVRELCYDQTPEDVRERAVQTFFATIGTFPGLTYKLSVLGQAHVRDLNPHGLLHVPEQGAVTTNRPGY